MAEDHNFYFEPEEQTLLSELVSEALQQNEEAFTQIEGDRSIVDIEDFTLATQDQRRQIDILKRLEVKLRDG